MPVLVTEPIFLKGGGTQILRREKIASENVEKHIIHLQAGWQQIVFCTEVQVPSIFLNGYLYFICLSAESQGARTCTKTRI